MNSLRKGLTLGLICAMFMPLTAQVNSALIQQFLNEARTELGLTEADVSDWVIYNQYESKHNGITHVYVRQRHQGIELFNAVTNFNIKEGKLLSMGSRFEANIAARANSTVPGINPQQAIEKAAQQLNLTITEPLKIIEPISSQEFKFNKGGIALRPITVKQMYQPGPEGELRLVWKVNLYQKNAQHLWDLRVDAQTGKILEKDDWVIKCSFPDHAYGKCSVPGHQHNNPLTFNGASNNNTAAVPEQYRVFASPVESPNHGSRTLELNPYDSVASPYGWHDTNGAAGAEYTITRGNNVHAYEDRADQNAPGYSPDGTTALNFDFPLNLNQTAPGYEDAAITNLFYWNNILHDVWYQYGFDEVSGNFQETNYSNQGIGGDYVYAEAQDGGGTNNANFATPDDGQNPTMQMYLWTGGSSIDSLLTINAPSTIAGGYPATQAGFGPGVSTTPITADLVLVDDATAPDINDGCETAVNGASISGKIAVLYRGNCNFTVKVANAQAEGALAVIVINNVAGAPIQMGGTDPSIMIPAIMVSNIDGAAIVAAMGTATQNATIVQPAGSGNFDKDGDFDNGVISHEYGHGISTRLTGGANNSSCLFNAEQMGEGWSDFFGLMMTMEVGDGPTDIRGVGTYASGQPTSGIGIRNAPYTTDMNVNPYTYDDVNDVNNVSQPHGVGFVWCTMLWDLNWALIAQYGFDPDLYNGTGGNNMCMQLVIDGIKLQACNPGFVDGRDAILLADQQLYGGANQCLIWEVFANRGLGASADQGSANNRADQVEAFDIPVICQTPIVAPTASFDQLMYSTCGATVNFEDLSTNIPQSWDWDFGDGNTSTDQNPTHTYAATGSYNVTLIVSNTLGADTTVQLVHINLPPAPVVNSINICAGQPATLLGSASGSIVWYDASGSNSLDTGNVFVTGALNTTTDYMAENVVFFASQYVGVDSAGAQGNGGYHNTGFTGTQNFEAFKPFTIVSAWLDAGSAGPRTIYLWNGSSASGTVVDSVVLNLAAAGPQRVEIGLEIPAPGIYSVGGSSIDLFRNNDAVSYPYIIPGVLSVNSSSATTDPAGFWYYLYDWEVQEAPCRSPMVPVTVSVSGAVFSYQANDLAVQFTDLSPAASSWEWDFGDGATSTDQNPLHNYSASGTYTVTLTVNGNASCVYTTTVTIVAAGMENIADNLQIELSPNPATDYTQIELSRSLEEAVQVQLLAVDGRILQETVLPAGEKQMKVDLRELPPAMYLLRLKTSKGMQSFKLSKKN